MTLDTVALGIDIGGTGIKGGIVDLKTGTLTTDRYKIPTPSPSTPHNVLDVVKEIIAHFEWDGPIGITIPSVVLNGITKTSSNIDKSWVDLDAKTFFKASLGTEITLINDADAAGIAETIYGAAKNIPGTILVLTVGTGIGSALICNGQLIHNTELGKLELHGKTAEKRAATSVKEEKGLSYEDWAHQFNEVLEEYHSILWPELFIIGGGISKKWEKWLKYLTISTPVVPAQLYNNAGIVGAAYLATH